MGGDAISDTQESLERLASDRGFAEEVLNDATDSAVALSRSSETVPGAKGKLDRALRVVAASALMLGAGLGCERAVEGAIGEGEEKGIMEDTRGEVSPELKKLEQELESGEISDEDLQVLLIGYDADLYRTSREFNENVNPENSKKFLEAVARREKAFKEAQERGIYPESSSR